MGYPRREGQTITTVITAYNTLYTWIHHKSSTESRRNIPPDGKNESSGHRATNYTTAAQTVSAQPDGSVTKQLTGPSTHRTSVNRRLALSPGQ